MFGVRVGAWVCEGCCRGTLDAGIVELQRIFRRGALVPIVGSKVVASSIGGSLDSETHDQALTCWLVSDLCPPSRSKSNPQPTTNTELAWRMGVVGGGRFLERGQELSLPNPTY